MQVRHVALAATSGHTDEGGMNGTVHMGGMNGWDPTEALARLKREHTDPETLLAALRGDWAATLTPDYSSWRALCRSMLPSGQRRGELLFDYWEHHGGQAPDDWAEALADAWVSMPSPSTKAAPGVWEEMFHAAGWIDDAGEPRPTRVPTLYRGCLAGHEEGLSWTDDLAVARSFYDRNVARHGDTHRVVLLARRYVRRGELLARFRHVREESEWVVMPPLVDAAGRIRVLDEYMPNSEAAA